MKSFGMAAGIAAVCSVAFGQVPPLISNPDPSTGSIEGQVFNLNTGAPLRKTTVRLTGGQAGMNAYAIETDEAGHFAFTGLIAGQYQLSAEHQGFLTQNYGARKYATGGRAIGLAQDQHVTDIVMKLSPQSVIVGTVLDDDGDPVANVPVRALRMGYRDGRRQWTPVAGGQASDIGEYRIPALDPGNYLVATTMRQASAMVQSASKGALPDAPEMVYGATYYPSTLDSATAVPVEVPRGQDVRGTDIRLRKTPVFRVRGNLANVTDGRSSVMVMLTAKDGGQPLNIQSFAVAPDYRFELRGVPAGSYVLYAQAGNAGGQASMAFENLLVANHVDGVVLAFSPGNDVQGTVKVEDATAPVDVSNVAVALHTDTVIPVVGTSRVKVGPDSKFTLKSVAPLHYRVSVLGAPDNCFVKSIQFGGQEVPDDGVDIVGGGAMEITLSATAGEVDAAVVDSDTAPVAGAIVTLIPKDGSSAGIQVRSGDEYGAARFKGLKPGEYLAIAWEDIQQGAWLDPAFRKPFEGRGETVKVDAGGRQAVQVTVIPASETDR